MASEKRGGKFLVPSRTATKCATLVISGFEGGPRKVLSPLGQWLGMVSQVGGLRRHLKARQVQGLGPNPRADSHTESPEVKALSQNHLRGFTKIIRGLNIDPQIVGSPDPLINKDTNKVGTPKNIVNPHMPLQGAHLPLPSCRSSAGFLS